MAQISLDSLGCYIWGIKARGQPLWFSQNIGVSNKVNGMIGARQKKHFEKAILPIAYAGR